MAGSPPPKLSSSSFISFTTVGFGDRIPLVENTTQLGLTLLYLTWGILLTTELFSILNKYFRKVFRPFIYSLPIRCII